MKTRRQIRDGIFFCVNKSDNYSVNLCMNAFKNYNAFSLRIRLYLIQQCTVSSKLSVLVKFLFSKPIHFRSRFNHSTMFQSKVGRYRYYSQHCITALIVVLLLLKSRKIRKEIKKIMALYYSMVVFSY